MTFTYNGRQWSASWRYNDRLGRYVEVYKLTTPGRAVAACAKPAIRSFQQSPDYEAFVATRPAR